MNKYVIITDSGCDLSPEMLNEMGIIPLELSFRFDGDDKQYSNYEMDSKTFYDKMRAGGIAKTAAVNPSVFENIFRSYLEDGCDIIYIAFSSGLSTTYNSSRIAAKSLEAEYPERKIALIDTRAASAGQGLIVYLANEKKKSGASFEEVAEYTEHIKHKISIWFTVDDLVYLKRGGRVSAAAAFFGNMLGIKPLLHMDEAGHLIPVSKIRGRRKAIETLADKYGELTVEMGKGPIFISHADCLSEAESVANIIKEKYNGEVNLITNVGPVIGAHSGPGTIALFFVGKEK